MGWGGPRAGDRCCPFRAPRAAARRAAAGSAGSRAPCARPVRPPGPLLPRCSRLWPGAKAGVCFLANLNPHCSPLARVVVGACLGGAWDLSADPGEQRGEGGSSPSRCGDAHCVCVPSPEAPGRGAVPSCGQCCRRAPGLRVLAVGAAPSLGVWGTRGGGRCPRSS